MLLEKGSIGKYKIIKRLGSGGFGSVYLGIDTWVKRKVAIKVPHNQSDPLEKLLKEARIQAKLQHPNIVQLYSAERRENIFFMVSEYIEGGALDRYLKAKGKLTWDEAVSIIFQVCDAVQFAHSMGIIHRDIRPANILLTRDKRVKMTDFGTSRYLNVDSVAMTRVGCPPYMAPEHFEGKATFQSDVYSIGMMFYELLVGKLPFSNFNPLKIEEEAKNRLFTSPDLKVEGLTKYKAMVIMKALAKSLKERFKTPLELKKAILKVSEGEVDESIMPQNTPVTGELKKYKRCWNCGKIISVNSRVCPHCNEKQ